MGRMFRSREDVLGAIATVVIVGGIWAWAIYDFARGGDEPSQGPPPAPAVEYEREWGK